MINSVTVGFFYAPEILRVGFYGFSKISGVFNGGVFYVNHLSHVTQI